jgi:hypothetical protein
MKFPRIKLRSVTKVLTKRGAANLMQVQERKRRYQNGIFTEQNYEEPVIKSLSLLH